MQLDPRTNEALTKMKADVTLTVIDYLSQPGVQSLQVYSHTVVSWTETSGCVEVWKMAFENLNSEHE